jgi:subtilisin-like proprotein convertase family protein
VRLFFAAALALSLSPRVSAETDQTPPPQPYTPSVVVRWNEAGLDAIRTTLPGPPVVARALTMLHTAMFDAWAAYDPVAIGTRLGGALRRPAVEHTPANKERAMSHAAYRVLVDLFPTQVARFDAEMAALGYAPLITSTDISTPEGVGYAVSQALLAFRHADGSNQLGDLAPGRYRDYTGYTPVNTPATVTRPDRWQPLLTRNGSVQGECVAGAPVTQTAVGPHWGLVIPFALDDGPVITPTRGPATYPSPEYELQARQIVSISAALTDREKVITEYWLDGPSSELPPGHWSLVATDIARRDRHTLDQDVRMFFAVTGATHDAGVLAWKLKRIHDSARPITAIRHVFAGQPLVTWGGPFSGTKVLLGENWLPYQESCFVTPAFPEFVSGHSTFSAAAAEALRRETGSQAYGGFTVFLAGGSTIEPGAVPAVDTTLSWPRFVDAADEAGISRRYGGIHFEDGDLVGRALGTRAGERAWLKAQQYIRGEVAPTQTVGTNRLLLPTVFGPEAVVVPVSVLSTTVNYALVDDDPRDTCVTLPVASDGRIAGVTVTVALSHTWAGDIVVKLASPSGTWLTLVDRPGLPARTQGAGADVRDIFPLTFADNAARSAESIGSGLSSTQTVCRDDRRCLYQPEQPLSTLTGESPRGTWRICARDASRNDIGALRGASITVAAAP